MRIVLLSALLAFSAFAQSRGAGGAAGHFHPAPAGFRPVRPAAPAPPRVNAPRPLLVPYPIFLGGGYYSGYAPAPVPDQTPIGVVNPNFEPDAVNPQVIDFSNVPEAASPAADADTGDLPDDQPTVYLIALTDHTVLASIAYWVDGDTLNWVSRDAKQNRISLSLVDRQFSQQLNDERHVPFKLPPAQPE